MDAKDGAVPAKPSLWHRFRYPVRVMLVANAAMIVYLFTTIARPYKGEEEEEKDQGQQVVVDPPIAVVTKELPVTAAPDPKVETEVEKTEATAVVVPEKTAEPEKPAAIPIMTKQVEVLVKPEVELSKDEKVEMYKWMLEEKRKVRPSNREEKARIDVEKGMLKDFIRGKISSF